MGRRSEKPLYEGRHGAVRWHVGRALAPVLNVVAPPLRKRSQKRLDDCYEAQFAESDGDEELALEDDLDDVDEANPLAEVEGDERWRRAGE